VYENNWDLIKDEMLNYRKLNNEIDLAILGSVNYLKRPKINQHLTSLPTVRPFIDP